MSKGKLTGKAAILAAAIAASVALPMVANASSITIDSVQQRWPWNNKVDITYTVTDGQNRAGGIYAGINFAIAIPGFDIPTFMMAEIAARAGATTTYFWNSNTADPAYVVCNENSGNKTAAVGSRLPNNWGLYDVSGNVWEWALDESRTNLNTATDVFKPIYTGGSWVRYRAGCAYTSAAVNHHASVGATISGNNNAQTYKAGWLGFRVFYIVQ